MDGIPQRLITGDWSCKRAASLAARHFPPKVKSADWRRAEDSRARLRRVNGARIWYQETGEGDPVVQIHGAGFGHFNFATATPILSKSFRCIDFDMRGYGQSERPFQHYSMEVWADDQAGLMDHLGLRGAHIHGTSMGGMVAQQFAAKYPERTQRLVKLLCGEARLRRHSYVSRLDRYRRAVWHGIAYVGGADRDAGALSRRFLDTSEGRRAVDIIQQISKTAIASTFSSWPAWQ